MEVWWPACHQEALGLSPCNSGGGHYLLFKEFSGFGEPTLYNQEDLNFIPSTHIHSLMWLRLVGYADISVWRTHGQTAEMVTPALGLLTEAEHGDRGSSWSFALGVISKWHAITSLAVAVCLEHPGVLGAAVQRLVVERDGKLTEFLVFYIAPHFPHRRTSEKTHVTDFLCHDHRIAYVGNSSFLIAKDQPLGLERGSEEGMFESGKQTTRS